MCNEQKHCKWELFRDELTRCHDGVNKAGSRQRTQFKSSVRHVLIIESVSKIVAEITLKFKLFEKLKILNVRSL